jgi:hypothetical protein
MEYEAMTSHIPSKTSWILVGLFVIAPSAMAMGRGSNPCEPAMDEFCGGTLELGHDKLVKCLKEHEAELPSDCKVLMEYKKGTDASSPSKDSD